MAKDGKIKKLYQSLARAEETALVSLLRNLGKDPYRDAVEMGESLRMRQGSWRRR